MSNERKTAEAPVRTNHGLTIKTSVTSIIAFAGDVAKWGIDYN
jgi:hypothetical protein